MSAYHKKNACITPYRIYNIYRSEGFALTGYDIPGSVEDGAWMLWRNSSVAAVAAAAVSHPDLGSGHTKAAYQHAAYQRCIPTLHTIWGPLGTILGPLGTIWGPSGDHLGTIWGPPGTSGDHLGPLGPKSVAPK